MKFTFLFLVLCLLNASYSQYGPFVTDSSSVDTIEPSDGCFLIEGVCNLKWQCSANNVCSGICATKDTTQPSLTVLSSDCGQKILLQVQLNSSKLVPLFENRYGFGVLNRLLHATNDDQVWMQDTVLFGLIYDSKMPERNFDNMKLFVDYDACNQNLYYIDKINRLKISQNSGPEISLNYTFKSVAAACIHFQNNEIYYIEYGNVKNSYVVRRAKLLEFNFQNIYTFSSIYPTSNAGASMKMDFKENRILISLGPLLLVVDLANTNNSARFELGCDIASFDFDARYIYATCNQWRNIRKFDYVINGSLINVTNDIFKGAPIITVTKTRACISFTTTTADIKDSVKANNDFSSQTSALIGGVLGGCFLLLFVLLIVGLYLYCRRSKLDKNPKSPPIPPYIENIYEENPYTEIDPYEPAPTVEINGPANSAYVYLIEPKHLETLRDETGESEKHYVYFEHPDTIETLRYKSEEHGPVEREHSTSSQPVESEDMKEEGDEKKLSFEGNDAKNRRNDEKFICSIRDGVNQLCSDA